MVVVETVSSVVVVGSTDCVVVVVSVVSVTVVVELVVARSSSPQAVRPAQATVADVTTTVMRALLPKLKGPAGAGRNTGSR